MKSMKYCPNYLLLTIFGLGSVLLLTHYRYFFKKVGIQNKDIHGNFNDKYKRIFFLETSTRPHLSIRQVCAIESAALQNPLIEVVVYMNKTQGRNLYHDKLQEKYNIRFETFDLKEILNNTVLKGFYNHSELLKTPFLTNHLSDAARIALIWKYGGIYLDTDVVIMKPLDSFKNTLFWESKYYVASGMMFFHEHHPFVLECMKEFKEKYSGKSFFANGPVVFTNVLRRICNVTDLKKITKNCIVQLLPREMMMPIPYSTWEYYFNKSKTDEVTKRIEESYGIHLWNGLSKNRMVPIGSDFAYERVAKEYCPVAYSFAKIFGYF